MGLLAERFWVTCYASLALGFAIPLDGPLANALVAPSLCGILFFTVLGIESSAVRAALSGANLARSLGLTAVKLLVLPTIAWALFAGLLPSWATAALLVAAVPSGLSSPTLAGLRRPDAVAPALGLVMVSSALAPLTIPLLLAVFTSADADPIALAAAQAQYIGALLVGPWLASRAIRRLAPEWVRRHTPRFRPIAVSCLVFLVFVAAAACRRVIEAQGGGLSIAAVGLFTMTALAAFLGVASLVVSRWLPAPLAVAFPTGAIFMNNGLAIALASRYFPNDAPVLVAAALVEVPILFGVHVVAKAADRLAQARGSRQAPSPT